MIENMDLYSRFTDYKYNQKYVSKTRKLSLLYALYDALNSNEIKGDLIKKSRAGSIDELIINSLEQVLPVSENMKLHREEDLGTQLERLPQLLKMIPHSRISDVSISNIFRNLDDVVEEYQRMLEKIEYLEVVAI